VSLKLDDPYRERMLGTGRKAIVASHTKKTVRKSKTRVNDSAKKSKTKSSINSTPKRKKMASARRPTD
jgi:hypothetical protein